MRDRERRRATFHASIDCADLDAGILAAIELILDSNEIEHTITIDSVARAA